MAKNKKGNRSLPVFFLLLLIIITAILLNYKVIISSVEKYTGIYINLPVFKTNVINIVPTIPQQRQTGSCFSTSITVPKENAYRCTVDNSIYDPCLYASDEKTLVCGYDPTTGEKGFVLDFTGSLPEYDFIEKPIPNSNAWIIELNDGTICSFATGATAPINNQRINYFCKPNNQGYEVAIIGDLTAGKVWHGQKAEFTIDDSGQINVIKTETTPLRTVWMPW